MNYARLSGDPWSPAQALAADKILARRASDPGCLDGVTYPPLGSSRRTPDRLSR